MRFWEEPSGRRIVAQRARPVLLFVGALVLLASCCSEPDALEVTERNGVTTVRTTRSSDPIVGVTRWEVVESAGVTTWSDGGQVVIPTEQWGATPVTKPVAATTWYPRHFSWGTLEWFSCKGDDTPLAVGTFLYEGHDASGSSTDLISAVGSEAEISAGLHAGLGRPVATPRPDTPDVDDWGDRTARPRALFLGVLGLGTLALAYLTVRVAGREVQAWRRSPRPWPRALPTGGSVLAFVLSGLGSMYVVGSSIEGWTTTTYAFATQPDPTMRAVAVGLGYVAVATSLLRPWLPATSTTATTTLCLAACWCSAAWGPWLLILLPITAGVVLRWQDLRPFPEATWGLLAAFAIVAVTVFAAPLPLAYSLVAFGLAASIGACGRQAHRPRLPDSRRPTDDSSDPNPDAAVGHPGG